MSDFSFCESRFDPLKQVADGSFAVVIYVNTSGQKRGVCPGDPRTIAPGDWTQVNGLALLLLAGV